MKKILPILLLLFAGVVTIAQGTFRPDDLLQPSKGRQQLVNDYSGVLTSDQATTLEAKLDAFDDSTSSQVAVVIIPSLGDYDIADYGVRLIRAWGIGSKEHNNGVALIVCTDPANHKVSIAVGYGLEGALPDIICNQILQSTVIPALKNDNIYRAVDQGTDKIIQATKGEYKAPEGYGDHNGLSAGKVFLIILIIVIFLMLRGGGGGFLGPMLLMSNLGGGGRGGSGFGGFGGGSAGGGGASGSW